MSDTLHVLLTPPGERTTLHNLGVLRVPAHCIEQAESAAQRFTDAGWLTNIIVADDLMTLLFGDEHPAVQRGQRYVEQVLS